MFEKVDLPVGVDAPGLKRKLMSCSHGQELGQLAVLAADWLFSGSLLCSQSGASLLIDQSLDNDYNS